MKRVERMALGAVGAAMAVAITPAASAAGDAALGQKLFMQCRACHTIDADGAHGLGPNLTGVVGSKAGSKPGYAYSLAMSQSGIVWTRANLDKFLTRPGAMVPGTKMAFAGLPSQPMRDAVIAYLATLSAPHH